jgi:taurine transport system substrate-binding protein
VNLGHVTQNQSSECTSISAQKTMERIMKFTKTLTAIAVAMTATIGAAQAEDLTVAYFLEWPTPNLAALGNTTYDDALGVKVKWVSFDTGTAMSAAIASGDVQIAFSQGVTPFLVATAAGQDLQIVDIAVTYSDNDNCVVRSDLEITKDNASELAGKTVGVPLGTAAHSGLIAQMKHFGVSIDSLKLVDMAPPDGAAAIAAGNLDMVCGWGGSLRRMKEHGNVLLSGAEKEAVVGKVFDVTSVPSAWAQENSDLLAKFLSVTASLNDAYAADKASMIDDIAKQSGMDLDGTKAVIDIFGFPTIADQLSAEWFDGYLAAYLKASADALEESGNIAALDSYEALIDSSYLEAAGKM